MYVSNARPVIDPKNTGIDIVLNLKLARSDMVAKEKRSLLDSQGNTLI